MRQKKEQKRQPRMASEAPKLSAVTLKQALWATLNDLRDGGREPGEGDAIASQAREILRTVKIQAAVSAQAKRKLPRDVVSFTHGDP